jgi:carbon-monoxide dehydrogenase medium subunit
MMNFRLLSVKALVDLNAIADLSGIRVDGDHIIIGAMTRQRQIENHADIKAVAPIFAEAIKEIGHRQTRNRGTIGGSLCQLDPSAELPLLCLLHDGIITVQSLHQSHDMNCVDFMRGTMDPKLNEGEIVTHIKLPLWPRQHGHAFLEYARRSGDFALASAGCLLTLRPDQTIAKIALGIGGLADTPKRLFDVESESVGHKIDATLIERMDRAIDESDGLASAQADVVFKKHITKTLLKRAVMRAFDRAQHNEFMHDTNH